MKKYIPKKSTITNLFVVPLIATAIFLARPAFAADDPTNVSNTEVRHKTHLPSMRKEIAGTVIAVNGTIVIVKSESDEQYAIDASDAIIMKDSDEIEGNPNVVMTSNIQVGDAIVVRGQAIKDYDF
jgi:hypothetical protein